MDGFEATEYEPAPDESVERFREAATAWLLEHPNEFWYHIAIRLALGVARLNRQGADPTRMVVSLQWDGLASASEKFALKVRPRFVDRNTPAVALQLERIEPEFALLHHGPLDHYELEPD
jgi:hypothetical protein